MKKKHGAGDDKKPIPLREQPLAVISEREPSDPEVLYDHRLTIRLPDSLWESILSGADEEE